MSFHRENFSSWEKVKMETLFLILKFAPLYYLSLVAELLMKMNVKRRSNLHGMRRIEKAREKAFIKCRKFSTCLPSRPRDENFCNFHFQSLSSFFPHTERVHTTGENSQGLKWSEKPFSHIHTVFMRSERSVVCQELNFRVWECQQQNFKLKLLKCSNACRHISIELEWVDKMFRTEHTLKRVQKESKTEENSRVRILFAFLFSLLYLVYAWKTWKGDDEKIPKT